MTIAACYYLLRTVDLSAVFTLGLGLSAFGAIAALALMALHVVICAIRWALVLQAIGGSFRFLELCQVSFIGNFFGQVLPGGVGGDAVRAWQVHRAGLPLRLSINSIVLDRVATIFGLLVLVTLTQPLLPSQNAPAWTKWIFGALTLGGVFGIAMLAMLDRVPQFLQKSVVVRGFVALAADSRRLFLAPRNAIPVLIVTVVSHAELSLVIWVLGRDLGAEISLLECLAIFPQVFLMATLPISIAGWGVRETSMVVLFGYIGVSAAQATAISVLFGLGVILVALPGAIVWFFSGNRSTVAPRN